MLSHKLSMSNQAVLLFLHFDIRFMKHIWTYLFLDKTAKQLFIGRTTGKKQKDSNFKLLLCHIVYVQLASS